MVKKTEDDLSLSFAHLSSQMRTLQDRYRTLIDNVDVGICIAKMRFDDDGKAIDYLIVDGNSAYERHTGLYGTVGRWVSEFAPDLERHWFDTYGQVALTGKSVRFENGAMPLGNRWFEVEAHRVGNPKDHEVAILFTDITERRRSFENQKVINRELSHRMKNFVSIVQSMVSQTLRTASTTNDAHRAIDGRLMAFARAQDLLGEEILDGADIIDVVDAALLPHRTDADQITVSGPSIGLSPRRALGLSLALHELATNAIKYGALSRNSGKVEIHWRIEDDVFHFSWTESGGPAVLEPKTNGFGSRLLERVVPVNFDGEGKTKYSADGVTFKLKAPK